MKRIFLLLFATLLFASCSSDDDIATDNKPYGTVTFDLNGETIILKDFYQYDLKKDGQKYGIMVHGQNYKEQDRDVPAYSYELYLEGPNEAGIYHVEKLNMKIPDKDNGTGYHIYTLYHNWPEITPELELIYDLQFPEGKISGTFSGELTSSIDNISITNGTIDYSFAKK